MGGGLTLRLFFPLERQRAEPSATFPLSFLRHTMILTDLPQQNKLQDLSKLCLGHAYGGDQRNDEETA